MNCNSETKNKKFCSYSCAQQNIYKEYLKLWKAGLDSGLKGGTCVSNHIRRYLYIKYDNKCCLCGWNKVNIHTGKIPLEIDHVDGNWKNNTEENLRLICPNCHSLTSTYKGANKGGRDRKKYKSRY